MNPMSSKITKAVVAAAGRGTRFMPVTKAYSKELLPLYDRPAIHWLIEELVAAGIREVLIFHRHGQPDLKRYFSVDEELEKYLKEVGKEAYLDEWRELVKKVKLTFKPQPRSMPYGTGTPVLAAKNFIGKDPFVYCYGDDYIAEGEVGRYLKSLIRLHQDHRADAVVSAQRLPWSKVSSFGVWDVMKNGKDFYQVRGIVEKPTREEAPSNLTNFGRMILPARAVKILKDQPLSDSGELYITDTINTIIEDGMVLTRPVRGKWVTIGNPDFWLAANKEFARLFG
jgi:UTP--glucose-1-phosphate uridylyltransferase